jgi:hypothetical protein
MYQKFDAHCLSGVWTHVHLRVEPGLGIVTLVEDRLQDVAVNISDVSVLPVEVDGISGAVPVPEAQCASTSRYRELLIEGTVSRGLSPREAAIAVD